MFPSIRNYRHRKLIFSAVSYGQTDAVHSDRPLWNGSKSVFLGVFYRDVVAAV